MSESRNRGSFRDPDGYVVCRGGEYYRYISEAYKDNYGLLLSSGLLERLVSRGLLISHQDADLPSETGIFKVIKAQKIPFISYPFEWCFSQLKAAALCTLAVQREALEAGMALKDASAYNIQFIGAQPKFIDLLSFQRYQPSSPWIAYRQFCQHFLAPLALMSYRDARLGLLLKEYIDGVPLPLTVKLLPWRSRFKFGVFLHVHMHARSQRRYEDRDISLPSSARRFSMRAFRGLVDSLESTVKSLACNPSRTAWTDYYSKGHLYQTDSFEDKKRAVDELLDKVQPRMIWDLGANTGFFSRHAAEKGISVVAFDSDAGCVENMYVRARHQMQNSERFLPLVMDMANPTPAIGWENQERMSLRERGPVDCILFLAFLHHLVFSNNLSLEQVARFCHGLCEHLIIEFIPKTDEQAKRLLRNRRDIFPCYSRETFEEAFGRFFRILEAKPISRSDRVLYLMKKQG